MNLPILTPSQPTCTLCDLRVYPGPTGHIGVPSRFLPESKPPSPETPALFCVGMNPGWNENISNQSFVGRAGACLTDAYLKGASLPSRCSIYLGNCARCYTPPETPPKAKHYTACLPYLLDDLAHVATSCSHLYILLLGKDAANTVLPRFIPGLKKMSLSSGMAHSGKTLPLFQNLIGVGGLTATIFVTFHPAAVLRAPNLVHAVNSHLQLLSDRLDNISPPKSAPKIVPARRPIP